MLSKKYEALFSFINGFGERKDSDVINAFFVAINTVSGRFEFDFESRGCQGVDSKEIRKILNFNQTKAKANDKTFKKVSQKLSRLGSDELAWAAQYLMNGETHLYPQEVKRAVTLRKSLSRIYSSI